MSKFLKYITAVLLLMTAGIAQAAETGWVQGDQLQTRLLVGDDGTAGLELRLNDGWHTYWRVSGDTGLPPRFDWSGSENVESVDVLWPVPVRMDEAGLTVFAYKNEVFLPLELHKTNPDQNSVLNLKLDVMTCHEICVPETITLSADLSEGTHQNARLIEHKKRFVPVEGDTEDLKIDTIVLGPEAIAITASTKDDFEGAEVFVTAGDYAFTAKPEILIEKTNPPRALIRIPRPADIKKLADFLAGKTLDVTLATAHGAVEKTAQF